MLPQEWPKFVLLYALAAVIGWWGFRVTSSYLLVAIMVGVVLVDLIVRLYLYRARHKPNGFTRFLRTDTMPKETTNSEIWKQVALSSLFYLFLAVVGAFFLLTVFESPMLPIVMVTMIFALLVPQRYMFIRRYYRSAQPHDEANQQQQLVFDANQKTVHGSRLLFFVYFVLVMFVMLGLIWLT